MIHDNLIDTILERAENYFNDLDYKKACKCYERALRRIFNTIEEENMKSMKAYEEKYELNFDIYFVIDEYLALLQDCFMETGDKTYLEKIINFKKKYAYLFEIEEYIYMTILRYEIEAIFYLGEKDLAFDMYKKLIKKYPTYEEIYMNMSRLYYEIGELNEAIKVLKIGIEKCEMGKEDMRQMKDIYEAEMKKSK